MSQQKKARPLAERWSDDEFVIGTQADSDATEGSPDWPIAAVVESDLDLVLLIEMHANPLFRRRLLEYIFGADVQDHRFIGAWRNTYDPATGETDVLMLVEHPVGHRTALLIEDKINAQLQPRQAERYLERGEQGRNAGRWDEFRTVLVAPASYITESTSVTWQRTLTVETAIELMSVGKSPYSVPLIKILRRAISAKNKPLVENAAATEFWAAYLSYAAEHFSELEVALAKEGPKGLGAIWPIFGSQTLKDSRISIRHKDDAARVDLIVPKCAVARLNAAVGTILPEGMIITQGGKDAVIRVQVPPRKLTEAFNTQVFNVKGIFEGGIRLLDFYKIHRSTLEGLVF